MTQGSDHKNNPRQFTSKEGFKRVYLLKQKSFETPKPLRHPPIPSPFVSSTTSNPISSHPPFSLPSSSDAIFFSFQILYFQLISIRRGKKISKKKKITVIAWSIRRSVELFIDLFIVFFYLLDLWENQVTRFNQ